MCVNVVDNVVNELVPNGIFAFVFLCHCTHVSDAKSRPMLKSLVPKTSDSVSQAIAGSLLTSFCVVLSAAVVK